ncbi:MAG: efflux RND transporter periplasmic adaptor subunit [Chromatiaceae bacterium]|nr:efflux RND transporter periplasmic adaptor subunit [Chromatiaceae bacterium]
MNTRLVTMMLTAALTVGANAAQKAPIDQAQRAAFGIQTVAVQPASSPMSKPYPAKVAVPNAQHRVISAPLDGVVETLLVAEGEPVKAGQPLARMRSQGLLELQAAYLESRTRRLLSGETLARDRQLHKEGIVARRRLLESESAHREMLTAESRDRQALVLAGMPESAIDTLTKTQQLTTTLDVSAPLDGVVLEQLATAGQRLAASDPLYRVGDLSSLWVEVHVPLDALGDIGPGSDVRLSQGLAAKVITVGRMVHGTDQGVLVRAEVREGTEALRPGQFVEARLVQQTDDSAVRVPAPALLRIDGVDQVFIERPDGFEAVAVHVLNREADEVDVKGSLSVGDQVVVSGTVALKAALAAGVE